MESGERKAEEKELFNHLKHDLQRRTHTLRVGRERGEWGGSVERGEGVESGERARRVGRGCREWGGSVECGEGAWRGESVKRDRKGG